MAITVADNFSYQGKKPLDGRDTFTTLAAMKAYAEASVYDGCLSYCDEDGKYYKFLSTNTVDPTTGKWREYSSGGGGQTYNDFTGATASTAGAHGLVPAPSAGDEGKVLFGNGLWGNLPSVDLSVLSNEAFIFEEGEKPVGMWKDRKLLWQKTVQFTTPKTFIANTWSTLDTISNGDNIAKVVMYRDNGVGNTTGVLTSAVEGMFDNGSLNVIVSMPANSIFAYTLQYTKTTDSPLAADEKFAGVTSTGEVILEKTVTKTNLSTGTVNIAHGISNYGELQEAFGRWTDSNDLLLRKPLAMQTDLSTTASKFALQKVDATNVVLYVGSDFSGSYNIKKVSITIRYTLAS